MPSYHDVMMQKAPRKQRIAKPYLGVDDERDTHAMWTLFARVKYAAAAIKPREPGQRPEELQHAAKLLQAALETAWRAGFKHTDLAKEMLRMF